MDKATLLFSAGAIVGAVGAALLLGNSSGSSSAGSAARANSARDGAVPPDAEIPMDLRRTTLVVDDIDNSLKFYSDALGMTKIYDKIIKDPRDAKNIEESTRWRRLVFLQANNSYVGVLGLLQYIKPDQPKSKRVETPMQNGSAVLLFNSVDDVRPKIEKAGKVPGARVHDSPVETSYPGYDGKSTIRVIRSVVMDPDGFAVECNQLLTRLS